MILEPMKDWMVKQKGCIISFILFLLEHVLTYKSKQV